MTGPWTAIEPAAAKPYSTGLEVGNDAVREHAVEADGHAQAGEQVHDGENARSSSAEEAVPEQHDRRERSGNGGRTTAAQVGDLGAADMEWLKVGPQLRPKFLDAHVTGYGGRFVVVPTDGTIYRPRWPRCCGRAAGLARRDHRRHRPEVPAYARPLEGPFGRALRVGVDEALRAVPRRR